MNFAQQKLVHSCDALTYPWSGLSIGAVCFPSPDKIIRDSEQVQRTAKGMVDNILDRLRSSIERWHRWHDDSPRFGRGCHGSQMSKVIWSFAQEQDQPSSLLERHVSSAAEQVEVTPLEISPRLRIEHGATIIPNVRNDPLDIEAPMSSTL